MSTEGNPTPETPPPAADPDANLRAALLPYASDFVPGGEALAFRLLKAELGNVAPSLLPDAIKARLASEDFRPLVQAPAAPDPHSREAIIARYRDNLPSKGGTTTTTDGRRIYRASEPAPAQQRSDAEARAAAEARRVEAATFWADIAKLPPAERLAALSDAYRRGQLAGGAPAALRLRTK